MGASAWTSSESPEGSPTEGGGSAASWTGASLAGGMRSAWWGIFGKTALRLNSEVFTCEHGVRPTGLSPLSPPRSWRFGAWNQDRGWEPSGRLAEPETLGLGPGPGPGAGPGIQFGEV